MGVTGLSVLGQPAGGARPARVAVAVVADDLLSGDGVATQLRDAPGLVLVAPERRAEADILVVVGEVTDRLLATMVTAQGPAVPPGRCAVLVADAVPARFVGRVVACGVVSVLPRTGVTSAAIAQVVLASAVGRSVLSPVLTRMLVDHCRDFEHVMRVGHGIVSGGLTTREVDVVRLLADGLSTAEIAARIPYSERTIKNLIQELLMRFGFRSRSEAVAYAFRVGAL